MSFAGGVALASAPNTNTMATPSGSTAPPPAVSDVAAAAASASAAMGLGMYVARPFTTTTASLPTQVTSAHSCGQSMAAPISLPTTAAAHWLALQQQQQHQAAVHGVASPASQQALHLHQLHQLQLHQQQCQEHQHQQEEQRQQEQRHEQQRMQAAAHHQQQHQQQQQQQIQQMQAALAMQHFQQQAAFAAAGANQTHARTAAPSSTGVYGTPAPPPPFAGFPGAPPYFFGGPPAVTNVAAGAGSAFSPATNMPPHLMAYLNHAMSDASAAAQAMSPSNSSAVAAAVAAVSAATQRHAASLHAVPVMEVRSTPVTIASVSNPDTVLTIGMSRSDPSGLSTYFCASCSKTFPSRSKLERHSRVHTREKPFKCPICKTRFTQKSSRNTHIKKHGVGALERLTAEETASRPGHHTQSSDGASDSDPSSDAESETAVGTSRDSVASPLLPSHTHSRTIAVEPRAVIVPAATAQ